MSDFKVNIKITVTKNQIYISAMLHFHEIGMIEKSTNLWREEKRVKCFRKSTLYSSLTRLSFGRIFNVRFYHYGTCYTWKSDLFLSFLNKRYKWYNFLGVKLLFFKELETTYMNKCILLLFAIFNWDCHSDI